MPIYEYLCDDCGARYERLVLSGDQPITCPKCSSGRHTLQLSVFGTGGKSEIALNSPLRVAAVRRRPAAATNHSG